jgi:branched-chain amino acid transport system permease protein
VGWEAPDTAYFAGRAGQAVWLYYVAIVVLVVACLLVWAIMHSRIGRAIVALGDNETAAVVMGIDRAFVRTVMFGISGSIAGVAGAMYAIQTGILTPDSFTLLLTLELLVGMVLGGKASFWGPVFGGFILYFVPVYSSELGGGPIAGVIFGLIVIVMVFVLPGGLVGGARRLGRHFLHVAPSPLGSAATSPTPADDGRSGLGELTTAGSSQ